LVGIFLSKSYFRRQRTLLSEDNWQRPIERKGGSGFNREQRVARTTTTASGQGFFADESAPTGHCHMQYLGSRKHIIHGLCSAKSQLHEIEKDTIFVAAQRQRFFNVVF